MKTHIAAVVRANGGTSAMARLVKVHRQEVDRWLSRGYVSLKHMPKVLKFAGDVTEAQLRKDIAKGAAARIAG